MTTPSLADRFIDKAAKYAIDHGLEVKVTWYGVEFCDDEGREVEHWDYAEAGEEESVRY